MKKTSVKRNSHLYCIKKAAPEGCYIIENTNSTKIHWLKKSQNQKKTQRLFPIHHLKV